jgi:hypothetical protein
MNVLISVHVFTHGTRWGVQCTHCTSTAIHNAENVQVYCNKCDKSVSLLSRKKILFDSYFAKVKNCE